MNGAFHVGGIGLTNQQRALDVIANNISNLNTQSFKRSDVRFSEIMATSSADALANANFTLESGVVGVTTEVQFMLNEQGDIQNTGNPLDIAIDGEGFIELMGPQGQTFLWRGGNLSVAEDGMLTARNGLALKSLINVPLEARALQISSDGVVNASYGDERPKEDIGQIMLVKVGDSQSLKRL